MNLLYPALGHFKIFFAIATLKLKLNFVSFFSSATLSFYAIYSSFFHSLANPEPGLLIQGKRVSGVKKEHFPFNNKDLYRNIIVDFNGTKARPPIIQHLELNHKYWKRYKNTNLLS